MEIRAARPGERDQVLDLLALWYNDRVFFARYNQNDPGFRDELCLVAHDGKALVSTVQIFDRTVNLGGHPVPMGGIGSVFTREDYRHKGVASDLMRLAVTTMAREGFEVSLLFAERLTFYNQFGWRELGRKFTVLSQAANISTAGNYEIDVFEPGRDLAAVSAIHRGYSGRFNVAAVRDHAAWRASLSFAGNQPLHPGEGSEEYFVLCRDAGAPGAYARVCGFYGVPMVMEYGYPPGGTTAMLALFKHFGELSEGRPSPFPLRGDHRRSVLLRKSSSAPSVLVTHTSHDPELESALAAAGSPVAYHEDNNYMWRIVAPDKLGARLGMPPEAASAQAFAMFADPRSLYWTADRF